MPFMSCIIFEQFSNRLHRRMSMLHSYFSIGINLTCPKDKQNSRHGDPRKPASRVTCPVGVDCFFFFSEFPPNLSTIRLASLPRSCVIGGRNSLGSIVTGRDCCRNALNYGPVIHSARYESHFLISLTLNNYN